MESNDDARNSQQHHIQAPNGQIQVQSFMKTVLVQLDSIYKVINNKISILQAENST